ncbi:DUF6443 domain-containing protein [Flavobacterium sp. LC2016-13]|uniref:DUF6443 domain-containing protein n=1 Tax=Flavobacterium sp. LC2016-13 TaxID=2675875 RepID=UPI0012B8FDFF|nr:DUF6443 domain-containing protein [Flavobacterium sp. LC2016-13]MTD67779.1 RHS repeat-associated core domain-containing protein [Flavobacterium sp. LC2016-13]
MKKTLLIVLLQCFFFLGYAQDKKTDQSKIITNAVDDDPENPCPGCPLGYQWNRDADGDGFGNPAQFIYSNTQPVGYVADQSDLDDGNKYITNIAPTQYFYYDFDHDTFGDPSTGVFYSIKPPDYVTNNTDCNDRNAAVNPNLVWYFDSDGDNFGTSAITMKSCVQPSRYVSNAGDYDDSTGNITNIAPQYFYYDYDHDTFGDPNVRVYYSVRPVNYVTNNTDCNDSLASVNPNVVWYFDGDGDGFGTNAVTVQSCTQPSRYVSNAGDYNDSTGNITNIAPQYFYYDYDHDGFGDPNVRVYYSVRPVNYVTNNTDCNDSIAAVNPNVVWYFDGDGDGFGASAFTTQSCTQPNRYVSNGSDYNDATGNITNIAPQYFYYDFDHDGFGNPGVSLYYSVQPTNYVINNTDCNDADNTLNPNTKWYADTDLDGLGDPSNYAQQCISPAGNYVRNGGDNCPALQGTSSDCSDITTPSSDYNYVISKTYKKPTAVAIDNPSADQMQASITYFDGLGRPVQQIANKQSSSGKDIVTHIDYDDFGRQLKEYLPYESSSTNMAFDVNAENGTITFYGTAKYENTANPFSEKQLESSPFSRVLKQAAPGTSWTMGSGHEIKLDYKTNTADEVKLYKATAIWNAGSGLFETAFSEEETYEANQLYKTVTFDENTSANPGESAGSTVEFKNKDGQVVLKRTYESESKLDTYYVYDIYGNLTYVIPPKADGEIDDEVLNGLCYQYKYDDKNRLVEKKLPGKQWEFIVYDKLDRPVATGPALSPFNGDSTVGWLITKYDSFGRPIYTGWKSQTANSAIRKSLQDAQKDALILFEKKEASRTIDGIAADYTNSIAPTSFKLLSVNYYDDYLFPNAAVVPSAVEQQTVLSNVKGMPTGNWIRVSTTALETLGETSTTFYDTKARPIRTYAQNYLGGYTTTDSKLDFTGKPLYTISKHKRTTGNNEITIREDFTYSPQDRLLTHTHQINGGVVQLLADNTYDALGQLKSKNVGNSTGSPLQKVDFNYNIRGWLTEINKTDELQQNTDPLDLFAFKINYDKTQTDIPNVKALYNGNIAETFWKTGSDNLERSYGYQYDKLNHLTSAIYQKSKLTTDAYNENLSYDKNGNIKYLNRNGDMDPQIGTNIIDNLSYTYPDNSNQLSKVSDSANNSSGFNDANTTGDDYTYDVNGNMLSDKNKNITEILYNQLNLPKKITFGTGNTIEYIYNAAGQKLEKIVKEGTTITNTNYLEGFQYKDNILEFFPTAEGYVKNTEGTLSYLFQYQDHLGNIRLSFAKNPTTQVLEIIEENNYYPFGLKHKGYNDYVATNNKYKYNGKELQDELGLGMYDYGARNYDPALGRWMNIDPLAEKSRRFSTYTYALNNPVYFIDPDGMMASPPDDHFDTAGNFLYTDNRKTNNIVIDSPQFNPATLSNFETKLSDYTFNSSNYSSLSKIAGHYASDASVDLKDVHNGKISVADAVSGEAKGGLTSYTIEKYNDGVGSVPNVYGSETLMNTKGSTVTVNLIDGKVDSLLTDKNNFTATLDHEGGKIGHLQNPDKKHTAIYTDELKKYENKITPSFVEHLKGMFDYYKKRGE